MEIQIKYTCTWPDSTIVVPRSRPQFESSFAAAILSCGTVSCRITQRTRNHPFNSPTPHLNAVHVPFPSIRLLPSFLSFIPQAPPRLRGLSVSSHSRTRGWAELSSNLMYPLSTLLPTSSTKLTPPSSFPGLQFNIHLQT